MMWWDGSGWGWFAMTFSMIVFWALVAAVIVMVVRSSREPATPGERADDPEQILRQRFARGEIDVEEYERRREVLRQ